MYMEYNIKKKAFRFIQIFMISVLFILCFINQNSENNIYQIATAASEVVIVLDPGHGSSDTGAISLSGNYESVYNEKIAKYAAQELEKYKNVKVYFTKYESAEVRRDRHTLLDRVQFAKDVQADLLVSFHCNASDDSSDSGALIILSKGEFKPELNVIPETLTPRILKAFESELGFKNEGILLRDSQSSYYDYIDANGKRYNADYYGLIRNSVLLDIPAMIIEHGYVTNKDDLKILDKEANLEKLGKITASKIAEYFNLSKRSEQTDKNLVTLKPQEELFLSENIPDTVYIGDGPITLACYGGSGSGKIFYESSDWAVLQIQGNKAVVVGNTGTAKITVTKRSDGKYASVSSKTYAITVKKASLKPSSSPTDKPVITDMPTTPTVAPTTSHEITANPTLHTTPAHTELTVPTELTGPTESVNISPAPSDDFNNSCLGSKNNTILIIITVEAVIIAIMVIAVLSKKKK